MIATTETCPCCNESLDAAKTVDGLCAACLFERGLEFVSTMKFESDGGDGESQELPDPIELEAELPEYDIIKLIGRGGMGAVYKARQRRLDRIVAVKILPGQFAHRFEFADRFHREARTLARLRHQNIVMAYDFGLTERYSYCTMEYVDGSNLRELMAADKIDPAEALRIVRDVCIGLDYAHTSGVIHRDIKPENILIDATGAVKITDFGLAKLLGADPPDFNLTRTGKLMGTVHYMAPEQCERPHMIDHRADLYSLGVVLYEMLTGDLPIDRFAAPSAKSPVGRAIDDLVMRALDNDPDRRPASAKNFAEMIDAALIEERNRCATGMPTQQRSKRLARLMIAAASIAAVATIVWQVARNRDETAGDGASERPPTVVATPSRPQEAPKEALPIFIFEPTQSRVAVEDRKAEQDRPSAWQLTVKYRFSDGRVNATARRYLVLNGAHIGRKEFALSQWPKVEGGQIKEKEGTIAAPNLRIPNGEPLEIFIEIEPRPDAKRLRASNTLKYKWTKRNEPTTDIRYPSGLMRPFTAIHWQDQRPHVEIGESWYDLLEINGAAIDDVIKQARQQAGERYQQTVENDLPGLLKAVGRELPESFGIKTRSWETKNVHQMTISTQNGKRVVSKMTQVSSKS